MKGDLDDPKALIQEAYRIENITRSECRSIFLDWALSLPIEQEPNISIQNLLERYQSAFSDHPMTETLEEGLMTTVKPRRRGGWKSRHRSNPG
tara:strand:- start:506 stop:784 length:279 start_codon:yes stop_codon:yes gene_type:complete